MVGVKSSGEKTKFSFFLPTWENHVTLGPGFTSMFMWTAEPLIIVIMIIIIDITLLRHYRDLNHLYQVIRTAEPMDGKPLVIAAKPSAQHTLAGCR